MSNTARVEELYREGHSLKCACAMAYEHTACSCPVPRNRRAEILQAALRLAGTVGYRAITRDGVALAAGVSAGLVNRYYQHIELLRQAVLEEGIRLGMVSILAEGLVAGDAAALAAPAALKRKAATSLLGGGV